MKTLPGTLSLAAAMLVAAPAAIAGKGPRSDVEYARVVSTTPIYRSMRISEPRQECWDERVVYHDHGRDDYWFDNGTAGAFIGAIAGGVTGHQFGKGRGKDAATALGAVIGAGVGQRVALERSAPRYERVVYEQRCRTVHDSRYEQRLEAYDVTYRYNGRLYHTRMAHHPGERIPVHVDVRPAGF